MNEPAPATLAIGTQVSAKYKGAFCEAKVRSVVKQVKCRVTFSAGLGITTLSDEYVQVISPGGSLVVGATVKAKHPDKQEYIEAVINKIQDQSQYTVVFDDGDITTLRRNALCMKSGKHYNASESLDNLPLTHPEHFSTPVSGSRRKKGWARGGPGPESDDEGSSSGSEDTVIPSSYLANIGRVVWAENTDKKSKARESWFPALIVAPSASGQGKIDTKEEFLIRSFKDGRYYTVSKKDTQKFHRDSPRKNDVASLKEAIEKAVTYINKEELPPLWDREVLFNMGEESTTESSETESLADDEENETQEDKDKLVAELYKHMEDRGSPINRTPTIGSKELDLFMLFKVVYKLGGHTRVTNNNMWRQVASKLGFETTWCTNQVRVHYKRYLLSFEELNKTLGCTMIQTSSKQASSRVQIRGKHRSGGSKSESNAENESDKSSIGSQDETAGGLMVSLRRENTPSRDIKTEEDKKEPTAKKSKVDKAPNSKETVKSEKIKKEEDPTSGSLAKKGEETKMATRPRRDSTSSLAAAMQVKAQKDNIGDESRRPIVRMDRDKDTENEARKLQTKPSSGGKAKEIKEEEKHPEEKEMDDGEEEGDDEEDPEEDGGPPPPTPTPNVNDPPPKKGEKKNSRDSPIYGQDPEDSKSSTDMNMTPTTGSSKSKGGRKKLVKKKNPQDKPPPLDDEDDIPVANEKQDLLDHVNVEIGDKIKVYYRHNQVYEAKVIKIREPKTGERWPKYLVHYQGWNARYDEWVKRSKIAENLSWSKERLKSSWTSRAQPTECASSASASSGTSIAKLNDSSNDSTSAKKELRTSRKDDKTPKDKEPVTNLNNGKEKASGRGSRKLPTPTTPSSTKNASDSRASTPSQSRGGSRTGSPALKRQSSRSSIKKESEESDEDPEGENSANARKSRRLNSSQNSSEGRRSGRKRPAHLAGGPNKDESENDEIDVEKDVTEAAKPELPVTPSKPKRTRKGGPTTPKQQPQPQPQNPVTPVQVQDESDEKSSDSGSVGNRPSRSRDRATTRQLASSGKRESGKSGGKASKSRSEEDEEEDPYAFKEPVPLDESRNAGTPGKATPAAPTMPSTTTPSSSPSTAAAETAPSLAALAKKAGLKEAPSEIKSEPKKKGSTTIGSVSTRSKRESDSAESSSDEGGKKNLRTSRQGSSKPVGKSGPMDTTKSTSSSEETEKEKKPDLPPTPATTITTTSTSSEVAVETTTITISTVAKVDIESNSEIETCKPNAQSDDSPDVKAEPKEEEEDFDMDAVSEDQGGKPVLNLTKKQQELFPFLSAMRTTPMSGVQISGVQISGSSLDGGRSPSKSPSKDCKTDSTGSDYSDSREDSKSSTTQASGAESSPRSASSSSKAQASGASTPGPHRKLSTKKRKTPRKPNSSELVASESESDLNSEDEKSNLAISLNLSSTASGRSRGPSPGIESVGGGSVNPSKGPSVKGLFGGGAVPPLTGSAVTKKGPEGETSSGDLVDEKPNKKKIKKEELQEDLDLACGETIPGSPVHPSSIPTEPVVKASKPSSSRLEMPFASVPESIPGPSEADNKAGDKKEPAKPANKPAETAPATTNTTTNSNTTASTSTTSTSSNPSAKAPNKYVEPREDPLESSSASQSPSDSRPPPDSPKSPAESSEVDMDSLSGRKEPESEDSRLDMDGGSITSETRRPKRKAPSSPAHSVKRKQRKTREAALRGSRSGRGRHSSSRIMSSTRGSAVLDDETDECEEPKDPALASLGNLDNDALTALTQRPPKASKYNFFVELNATMTSKERVSKLQESIDRLRKTYLNVKSDLAQVERRRKKMKRKEREKSEKASTANNANTSAGATVVEAMA
ncbi:hypothetical protein TCAL_05405 [Tigriopus californicus]|uniref:ARID domain-containing protein n=1 Tax=Tigriopus californicus TaxID=6832 RepID=A0A553P2V1_TIGCA|nr:AT-rich interactive domain-containing protein 4B-like [Tigriopus californicus]TRY72004.1 hypothetical protein TCAL_05405 [Tigriopus californicus]|eukprot:TCALIF_05405-PA protein Name:"Similar to Arid4b AT-rich interactive domain-containing protein 4B (Rattus norvegicus)" AED:0.00 eAED:0.00 QI:182/1/1/1/1/1/5/402/1835